MLRASVGSYFRAKSKVGMAFATHMRGQVRSLVRWRVHTRGWVRVRVGGRVRGHVRGHDARCVPASVRRVCTGRVQGVCDVRFVEIVCAY